MPYCLSCWAWEPSPRTVPWCHSYLGPQVVLTFGLEPHLVIVMGFLLITFTAQNLGFGVMCLQKDPGDPGTVLNFHAYTKQGWVLPCLLPTSHPSSFKQITKGEQIYPPKGPHTEAESPWTAEILY